MAISHALAVKCSMGGFPEACASRRVHRGFLAFVDLNVTCADVLLTKPPTTYGIIIWSLVCGQGAHQLRFHLSPHAFSGREPNR